MFFVTSGSFRVVRCTSSREPEMILTRRPGRSDLAAINIPKRQKQTRTLRLDTLEHGWREKERSRERMKK